MVSSGLLHSVALVALASCLTWYFFHSSFLSHLVFLRSVRRFLVAACVVPSAPIFVILMKEAPGSFETSVLTRATRCNNPEYTIFHDMFRPILPSLSVKRISKGISVRGRGGL
jgi:hypothetical protein